VGTQGQSEADKLVARSLDAGINFFDTADVYSNGVSEQLLGKALGARRKDVILATKVRGRTGPGINDVGLSRGHIMDSVHASLRRLGTDYIDLYQIHGYDIVTPLDETLRAMGDLERELVPLMKDQQLGLMVWSPLAGGFLSGKFRRDSQGPRAPAAPPSTSRRWTRSAPTPSST
jgi:aryl-alcohol dehydrogenase-like predicted oxidoreductase